MMPLADSTISPSSLTRTDPAKFEQDLLLLIQSEGLQEAPPDVSQPFRLCSPTPLIATYNDGSSLDCLYGLGSANDADLLLESQENSKKRRRPHTDFLSSVPKKTAISHPIREDLAVAYPHTYSPQPSLVSYNGPFVRDAPARPGYHTMRRYTSSSSSQLRMKSRAPSVPYASSSVGSFTASPSLIPQLSALAPPTSFSLSSDPGDHAPLEDYGPFWTGTPSSLTAEPIAEMALGMGVFESAALFQTAAVSVPAAPSLSSGNTASSVETQGLCLTPQSSFVPPTSFYDSQSAISLDPTYTAPTYDPLALKKHSQVQLSDSVQATKLGDLFKKHVPWTESLISTTEDPRLQPPTQDGSTLFQNPASQTTSDGTWDVGQMYSLDTSQGALGASSNQETPAIQPQPDLPSEPRIRHAPPSTRVQCTSCFKEFRGPNELRRHWNAQHATVRVLWRCCTPAPDGILGSKLQPVLPLEDCDSCSSGKVYKADYNAAAHLRRRHFWPKNRSEMMLDRDLSEWPPMEELRHNWFEKVIKGVGAEALDKTPESMPEGEQVEDTEKDVGDETVVDEWSAEELDIEFAATNGMLDEARLDLGWTVTSDYYDGVFAFEPEPEPEPKL